MRALLLLAFGLPACSAESPREDPAGEKVAQASSSSARGFRLRTPGARGTAPGSDLAGEPPGCAHVDTGGMGDDPGRNDAQVKNRVTVNAGGEILWNGARIDAPMLGKYLDLVATMTPTPLTVVRTEAGADPEVVEAVRDAVSRSLDCPLEAY